ncbi:MAG: hypothetical protein VW236_07765 [Flavobacteriaceae bacterium]
MATRLLREEQERSPFVDEQNQEQRLRLTSEAPVTGVIQRGVEAGTDEEVPIEETPQDVYEAVSRDINNITGQPDGMRGLPRMPIDREVSTGERGLPRYPETPEGRATYPERVNREEAPRLIQPDIAATNTIIDTIITGEETLEAFQQRFTENSFSSTINATVAEMSQQLIARGLDTAFQRELNEASSEEEYVNVINKYRTYIPKNGLGLRELALISFVSNSPVESWNDDLYANYYSFVRNDPEASRQIMVAMTEEGVQKFQELKSSIDQLLTNRTEYEAIANAAYLLFAPLQETSFINALRNRGLDLQGSSFWASGSTLETLRDWLSNDASEDEILTFMSILHETVEDAETSPLLSFFWNEFSLRGIVDFLINEDFLQYRESDPSKLFEWASNLAGIADAFVILGPLVRGVGTGLDAGDIAEAAIKARRGDFPQNLSNRPVGGAADTATRTAASAPHTQTVLDLVQNPTVQRLLKADEPDVAVGRNAVKPDVDGIELRGIPNRQLAQMNQTRLEEAQRVTDLANAGRRLILTEGRKAEVIDEQMDAVEGIMNVSTPWSHLSRIDVLPDDSGVMWNLVGGASDVSGYLRLSDALEAARRLDPTGVAVTILKEEARGRPNLVPMARSEGWLTQEAIENQRGLDDFLEGLPATRPLTGDEGIQYFVSFTQERPWHSTDNILAGDSVFLRHTGGFGSAIKNFFSRLAPLGWQVRREYSDSIVRLYQIQEGLNARLARSARPFYDLGSDDRNVVMGIRAWEEEFQNKRGTAATLRDVFYHFDDLTEKQVNGYLAMRHTMDAAYDMLNNRLRQELLTRGAVSAVNRSRSMATYHGDMLQIDDVRNPMRPSLTRANRLDTTEPVHVFNPVTKETVVLNADDLGKLYERGGAIIRSDIPEKVSTAKVRTQHRNILIDPDEGYRVGGLSDRVLDYTGGYTFRFYDEPYQIIRRFKSVTEDGVLKTSKGSRGVSTFDEIVATADGEAEALAEVARLTKAKKKKSGVTYEVVRLFDLEPTERLSALQRQLHQEGRLLWGTRNTRPTKSLSGNPTRMLDPITSMQNGLTLVTREMGQKDWLAAMKVGFKNKYGRLLGNADLEKALKSGDSRKIKELLAEARKTISTAADKELLNEATKLFNWLRLIEGSTSDYFAVARMALHELGVFVGSYLPKAGKLLERGAYKWRPIDAIKGGVFNSFIALFPARHALLNTMQVSFISGLDPLYVLTGRIFADAAALRLSLGRRFKLPSELKDAEIAGRMGYSAKAWSALVDNLYKGGLLETVTISSFAGGLRRGTMAGDIDPIYGTAGKIYEKVRRGGLNAVHAVQKVGFDFGERNNLTFSYLMAARLHLKESKVADFAAFTKKDWDQVLSRAQSLGIGMVRPLDYRWQHGILGLATQFLSFGIKSAVSMLGANPSMSGINALKVTVATHMMFGANMWGASEWLDKYLSNQGLNFSKPVRDVMVHGIIDIMFNRLMQELVDDYQNLNIGGFAAPGPNFSMMMQTAFEGFLEAPSYTLFAGPSGIIGGRLLEALDFSATMLGGGIEEFTPSEKFSLVANAVGGSLAPQWSNIFLALAAGKLEENYTASGYNEQLEPTLSSQVARSVFGIGTRDQATRWSIIRQTTNIEDTLNEIADTLASHMLRARMMLNQGEIEDRMVRATAQAAWVVLEDLDDDEALFFRQALVSRLARPPGPEQSMPELLVEYMTSKPFDQYIVDAISSLETIDQAEKDSAVATMQRLIDEPKWTELLNSEGFYKQQDE